MSQIIPIYIPTYISDQNYNPSRVLPRLFYYNGLVDCETYYIQSGSLTTSGVIYQQTSFPYFDNYNVVSGSFPTDGSNSLLFNNEAVSYGALPSGSLFTTYWDTYVSLLYNPKTRLLTCKAIIPLADYTKMELNDIVNFRGNYYHLRAINNYSLKTGDCELQLLGPIISDTISDKQPEPPPPIPTSASVSWTNITDNDVTSSFRIYDNGSNVVSSSTTEGGTFFVSQSHTVNAEMDVSPFPITGSVTMSINVNGYTTIATSSNSNVTLTASFISVGGESYQITGSVIYNPSPLESTLKVYVDALNSLSYTSGSTTWYDLTTNANNLTITGSPSFDSTTGSLYFATSSMYSFNTALSNTNVGTGSFSTEIWERYRGTNDANYHGVFEWGKMDSLNFDLGGNSLYYGDDGLADMLYERVGGIKINYILPTLAESGGAPYNKTTDLNNWRQVVVTRESGSFDVKMYVNGNLYKSGSNFYTGSINESNKLYVGSNNPSNPFGGQFANDIDVAIFKLWTDKVLNATEVSASFAANKNRFGL